MLAPEFPPVWGGVGTYSFELVRHLPKNIEVHVITPRRESFGKQKTSALESKPSEYLGSNVYIHYISKATDSFFYNARFQYACLKQIPKFVKEEKIDVIHSHTAHMPDLLLMFRKLNVPTITTVHTTIKSQRIGTKLSKCALNNMEKSEKATSYLYPFLRAAENLYFKHKRAYITPSCWMKEWLIENFHISAKINVIPNFVDPEDYRMKGREDLLADVLPKDSVDKQIVLYAGRILALKGVDVLINAIPEISNRIRSDELLFVFSGPGDDNGLRQRLEKMNIHAQYLFTGPLPKEKLIPLMIQSALVVLPSYQENCPYTVLESMACGTPVVASNVGGIPEIITNNFDGVLVNSGSSTAFARAIANLLEDRSLRDLMGKRATSTINRRFSWKTNLPEYLNTYYKVMN